MDQFFTCLAFILCTGSRHFRREAISLRRYVYRTGSIKGRSEDLIPQVLHTIPAIIFYKGKLDALSCRRHTLYTQGIPGHLRCIHLNKQIHILSRTAKSLSCCLLWIYYPCYVHIPIGSCRRHIEQAGTPDRLALAILYGIELYRHQSAKASVSISHYTVSVHPCLASRIAFRIPDPETWYHTGLSFRHRIRKIR